MTIESLSNINQVTKSMKEVVHENPEAFYSLLDKEDINAVKYICTRNFTKAKLASDSRQAMIHEKAFLIALYALRLRLEPEDLLEFLTKAIKAMSSGVVLPADQF